MMQKEIFSLGSIIEQNGIRLMIAGFFLSNGKTIGKLKYLCVPYPAGYRKPSSVYSLDADQVTLLRKGYESTESKVYSFYLAGLRDLAKAASQEALRNTLDTLGKEER